MRRKFFSYILNLTILIYTSSLLLVPWSSLAVSSGNLIKIKCDSATISICSAVYYLGADGKRYVFPNEKTYKTWYNDFSKVQEISRTEMESYTIGGNATYKPGVKMVKITTDPKCYAVAANGTLRWVQTEALAIELYGANWNTMVEDVSDAFFVNYKVGEEINDVTAYNKDAEIAQASSINVDKGLGGKDTEPPPPDNGDTTVPTISNLVIRNIISAAATIFWQTDVLANSKVYYNTQEITDTEPGLETVDQLLVTDHSLTIQGLLPSTKYYFLIKSEDEDGNSQTESSSFTTLASETLWSKMTISEYFDNVSDPAIAVVNSNYGAVWSAKKDNSLWGVYYSKINQAGRKIGQNIKLSNNSGDFSALTPSITANNNGFGVVWSEYNLDNPTLAYLKFVKIDVNGNLVSEIKAVVSDNYATPPADPQIVYSDSNYGLVWSERQAGNAVKEIYFARLDNNGDKVVTDIQITTKGADSTQPDIESYHSGYGLTWKTGTSPSYIYYTVINSLGIRSFSPKDVELNLSTTNTPGSPKIAWDGSLFNVVWYDYNAKSLFQRQQYYFQSINDGGSTTTPKIAITDYDSGNDAYEPNLVWADSLYNMLWRKNAAEVNLISMDQARSYKREATTIIEGSQIQGIDFSYNNGNFGIVWTDLNHSNKRNLFFTFGK